MSARAMITNDDMNLWRRLLSLLARKRRTTLLADYLQSFNGKRIYHMELPR